MTDPTPDKPPTASNRVADGLGATVVFLIGGTCVFAVACAAFWTCRHLIAWALS